MRLARTSRVPCGARASVRVDSVLASAPVFARVGRTFVDVRLARTSRVPGGARASVRVDSVLARAPVFARTRSTLINVGFAVHSFVAVCTCATIGMHVRLETDV